MIMRLLKSLYGLRQSAGCWYGTVDEHVVEIGLKSLKPDPCVYISSEGGVIYVLALYVDDVLVVSNDLVAISHFSLTLRTIGRGLV